MKIVVSGELPGLNKIIDKSKAHHMAFASMKKKNTNLVTWKAKGIPKMESIYLNIKYYCKDRRRDPDNIAAAKKFILDGLVGAGVIENDGWKQVKGWSESWEKDKENPRIEIEIKEADQCRKQNKK